MKFPATLILCVNRFMQCAPKAMIASQQYRTYGRVRFSNSFDNPAKDDSIDEETSERSNAICHLEACHYTTDKLKKKYAQTWVESTLEPLKPIKLPCFEETPMLPPITRRKPEEKPITATCPLGKMLDSGPCLRIKVPKTKFVRDLSHMNYREKVLKSKFGRVSSSNIQHREKGQQNKTYCTPCPSFSECQKRGKLGYKFQNTEKLWRLENQRNRRKE